MGQSKLLSVDEALSSMRDACIVGIRWDLVPWGLVLDLDVPASEEREAPVHRAWIIFSGLSEISWPLESARIPNGCWITSAGDLEKVGEYQRVTFLALLGKLGDAESGGQVARRVSIDATQVFGAWSLRTADATNGRLSRESRLALASDEDLLSVLPDTA